MDHPNIVKYYETYIEDLNLYLVMEHIGGGELFKMIMKRAGNCLTEREAKQHIQKLLEALNHMHL
jgi:serine/threonine protein kinase